MRAKRKLIPHNLLCRLVELDRLGVPLAKLIRDNNLAISTPHLVKLILWFELDEEIVHKSLFPQWLQDNDTVQEEPDGYKYVGRFPYGTWEQQEQ